MSKLNTRRRTGLLVATAALLSTVFIITSSADASTLYACVKKNGSGRLFTKKPKCKKRERKISWNTSGIPGKNGANGANGLNGANGANGAVAGFSANATGVSFTQLGTAQKSTTVLTKALPAGSYIVNAKTDVLAAQLGKNSEGGNPNTTYVNVSCTLSDSPANGSVVSDTAFWTGFTNIPVALFALGDSSLPMSLAVTTTTASTLEISCTNLSNDGKGSEGSAFNEEATGAVVTAVQTTKNS